MGFPHASLVGRQAQYAEESSAASDGDDVDGVPCVWVQPACNSTNGESNQHDDYDEL